jgi:hypothetical protein
MTLHPIPLNFLIYEEILFYFLSVQVSPARHRSVAFL